MIINKTIYQIISSGITQLLLNSISLNFLLIENLGLKRGGLGFSLTRGGLSKRGYLDDILRLKRGTKPDQKRRGCSKENQ